MERSLDGILRRMRSKILHSYEVGKFGGGTSEPEYRDKDGNIVPFEQTKWAQLKKKEEK